MPGSKPKSKQKKSRKRAHKRTSAEAVDQLRPGMPAKDNVREVVDFVSPQNVHYRILKTTETDAYDPVPGSKKKRGPKS